MDIDIDKKDIKDRQKLSQHQRRKSPLPKGWHMKSRGQWSGCTTQKENKLNMSKEDAIKFANG